MTNLSGKTAFVTGASAGIGYALAEAFIGPIIKIVARVDREFSGLPERWAFTATRILGEGSKRAGDPMIFTDIARSVSAAHV